jgi:putative DNA primase/helicase
MSETDDPTKDRGYYHGPNLPPGVATFGNAPVPQPLPSSLLPVASFDMGLMPEKFRPWATDLAERMQCPADFIGVSLMTSAASVIGRKVAIRPMANDDWSVVCNGWALLVGRPGLLKSPAMEWSMRGLNYLAVQATEQFKAERAKFELGAQTRKLTAEVLKEAAKKQLKKDRNADIGAVLAMDEEPEPTLRRYVANDTTVESLGVLLQQNPNGFLVYRDEMLSLLDSLDQEQNASQKGFYLTAWNGDSPYIFDRIGRGLNLAIPAVCLSLLGSTQPGRIAEYLGRAVHGGRHDDGLIQRFGLLVWPDPAPEWELVDRAPDPAARREAYEVFEHLDKLDWREARAKRDRNPSTGEEEGIPSLRFSIEGYDKFVEWRVELERRLRSDEMHPALESHLAKYRKLVPAIALISHLADGGIGPVTTPSVVRAIGWARYLETHAQRAYGSVTAVAGDAAREIVNKFWDGKLRPGFTARDIHRAHWSRLSIPANVQAALDLLVDHNWLIAKKVDTGGRPMTTYTLSSHPAAARPTVFKPAV